MERVVENLIALPEIFLSRMKEMLGAEEYEEFILSYNKEPVKGLRLNLLKIKAERESFEKLSLFALSRGFATSDLSDGAGDELSKSFIPVPWCETGFVFPGDERPAKSIEYHAGLFYIQEPSAMYPAEVLDVKPGHSVLDLCAAPGGKSVQIAGHLRGGGLLVSNDASPSRSRALVKNLERAGVTNAVVLTEQPKKLAERFPAFFDRILIDAPCSGEGMFRRDPDAVKAYTANKPGACAAVQTEILRRAVKMLKADGQMVYSTCTFNKTENEEVINSFLKNHEGFTLEKTERIFPHKARGEGHFAALLRSQRSEAGGQSGGFTVHKEQPPSRDFSDFCKEFLDIPPPSGHYVTHGINLYLQKFPLNLQGLRVARSGWHLGECAKGRFIPSQALAMGLSKEQAKFSVNLSETDAEKYLRGESLYTESFSVESGIKPWVLICCQGFPLGWARLVQGRLKNNLPVGWAVR